MRLYNSLSRKVEEFKPIEDNLVKMYHCGPTVYNYAHIGNMRAYVFADTIRRAFEYLGFKTTQVINITDVGHLTSDQDTGEDKVEVEARKEHKTAAEVVNFYTNAFYADLEKLNIPNKEIGGVRYFPKASDHIQEQIRLIETLEKKGVTYKTTDGIYFDTSKFKAYGKLGQINLENLEEGARIDKNLEKKNHTDFALWKFSKPEEKRQQEWPSPWGVGFPGWHIECSAMAMKYLGETFDIHTGGVEHIPVHHNNEIAQSECVTNRPHVNFWLHNEFVNIESGKMSKSKGNVILLSSLRESGIHPLAYRYWLLTAHARSPILYSMSAVKAAQTALEAIISRIAAGQQNSNSSQARKIRSTIKEAVENNLDTPAVIALLNDVSHEIAAGKIGVEIIADFDAVLGLDLMNLAHYITEVPEKIKKLSRERESFRLSNNWPEADRLRQEIQNEGFFVEDSAAGPRLRRSLASLASEYKQVVN